MAWMFKLPGAMVGQVYGDCETEADARAWIRQWMSGGLGRKVKRLPSGTDVWQEVPRWEKVARANRRAGFNIQTGF